jgi:hypothetical protein
VFEAVAVAFDVDDGGAVEETIEGGAGHDGIGGEDVAPVGEGFVAGEDDGVVGFVAFADDLEEEAGLGGVELEVADFVDDQEGGTGRFLISR